MGEDDERPEDNSKACSKVDALTGSMKLQKCGFCGVACSPSRVRAHSLTGKALWCVLFGQ